MTRSPCLAIVLFALGILLAQPASAAPANYARPCEPEVKPAFLPLPPGGVEPAGWLRDWAVAARQGITGHLDEYHSVFRDGWKGPPPGQRQGPDGTGWPLEQCAYWLDGALRLGFVLHDEALIRKIRARLDPIVDGVNKADFGTSLHLLEEGLQAARASTVGPIRRWAGRWWRSTRAPATSGCSTPWSRSTPIIPANMGNARLQRRDAACATWTPCWRPIPTAATGGSSTARWRPSRQPDVARDIQAWAQGSCRPGHMVILYENIRLPAVVYPWSGDRSHLQATLERVPVAGRRTTCSPTAWPPARSSPRASAPSARPKPAT